MTKTPKPNRIDEELMLFIWGLPVTADAEQLAKNLSPFLHQKLKQMAIGMAGTENLEKAMNALDENYEMYADGYNQHRQESLKFAKEEFGIDII